MLTVIPSTTNVLRVRFRIDTDAGAKQARTLALQAASGRAGTRRTDTAGGCAATTAKNTLRTVALPIGAGYRETEQGRRSLLEKLGEAL